MVLSPPARQIALDLSAYWCPPERQSLSIWAERNIHLSPEYSARSGPVKLYHWQREIFDSFTDPYTREVNLMVGVQMVKTLYIQCAMAYAVKEAPGPILMVMPKEEDGKEFSKERLVPMVRDNACLKGLLSDSVHDGSNTILGKSFPGGRLSIVSAVVPGNLARRSIRYLFCDEVDKYPISAGKEGDPMDLAAQRMVTFGSRAKLIRTCSPTVAGESRISKAYRLSDQRKLHVECPVCHFAQILKWPQVKFNTALDRERIPSSAYYQCVNTGCNARWSDVMRWKACNSESARWIADKPFDGIAGFWISHLYSPWKKLSDIVDHFLRVKDDRQQFQVFVNTVLAEEWEEKGETPDSEILYGRREDYPHTKESIIPQRGLFLTAAVDVQDNPPRLECEVRAWGRGRENWSVGYFILQRYAENGELLPVTSTELWDDLDRDILQRDWIHESGNSMPIFAMCIDTGSRPKPVYDFALLHPQIGYSPAGVRVHSFRTVIPVKGNDDPLKIISAVSKETAAAKRQHVRIVMVGTIRAKQEIYDSLRAIKPDPQLRPRPGLYHFPLYERGYFDQLCSEYRIVQDNGRGGTKVIYQKRPNVRNEALDCSVYNLAAAYICGIDRIPEEYWRQLEAAVAPLPVEDLTELTVQPDQLNQVVNQTVNQAVNQVVKGAVKSAVVLTPKSRAVSNNQPPPPEPPTRKIRKRMF